MRTQCVSATSSGVCAALKSVIDEIGGEARVYGTKPVDGLSTRNYASAPVTIEFFDKPAHAAGCQCDGINALDAQILTYQAIGVLRQQLSDRIRIHGIITDVGTAPNVIPEYTKAKYCLRASYRETLDERKEAAGLKQ